jgi:hypothetical protein
VRKPKESPVNFTPYARNENEDSPYKPDASLHSLDKDKTARIGELIYSDVSVWSIVI